MREELKEKGLNILTIGLLLLIVIGGMVLIYPHYRQSESLKRENAELQETIERKKREVADLMDKQRRFATDRDFVEMIARENRRVFPGELVFTFDKE